MHLLLPVSALLFIALPAAAATPVTVTCCLDGARIEKEAAAVQGRIDIPLPRGAEIESLRVKPLHGATINRVEIIPIRPDPKVEKEVSRLTERKDALSDLLKALTVKEDILRAAAKSQSAKSPRPSKSNREPLETIRKGTEFAIVRLEEVYRTQRKAERERKSIETRLAELNDAGNGGRRIVQIWLAEKSGRVLVSYRDPGLKWTPAYDFRLLDNGEVEVIMSAHLPAMKKGEMVSVAPGFCSENLPAIPTLTAPDGTARVAVFRFPLEKEDFTSSSVSAVSFLFTNRTGKSMPSGESTCYLRGEYIGKTRFEGCLPGDSKKLVFGSPHQQ